jgi:hypothetical protein
MLHEARMMFELVQEAAEQKYFEAATQQQVEKLLNDVWNVTKSPKSKKSQERYQTTLMTR